MTTVTLKELHGTTGEIVRRAGKERTPTYITDRGEIIAVLTNPALVPAKRRQRVLLPEFEKMMQTPYRGNLQEDLDAVRGEI
ncbi:MAG: type II toxin-antitoxin system Phd/YefM family antitoxin [Verrucomicrobiales bacterium]|jgi:antitoxin (DNA-binding transcriptional repressor) of toxin-antitoxin stability system|nr:type II toxin-antitoxin system Phd/YefM family antitoxin [Verrucomicrobiales bacterium]